MKAPPTAPVVRRILATFAVAGAAASYGFPAALGAAVDVPPASLRYLELAFASGVTALFLAIAGGLLFGLRGVAGAAQSDEVARRRVLRLPVRIAGAVAIGGGAMTGLAVLLRIWRSTDPASLVFGVGLCTTALAGFLAVPSYIVARAALLPHARFFANEGLPSGRRLPIGVLAGYTVLSVAAVSLVPAAVLGNARLAAAREQAASARALASARRIAWLVGDRGPVEALRLVSRTHLDNAIVLLRMPSGQLLPDDLALEAAGATGEEASLGGELRGGAIRVIVRPRRPSQVALLLLVLGLVGVSTLVAVSLAQALSRDARGVTRQVAAVADDRPPPPAPTLTTSEIRRVALAVNRLLERIPRLQLEKFLAIERADESRRLKSMFLANMSHDLRSPLNSILGFSDLLIRGIEGELTQSQRAHIEDVQVTGNQLLRLLTEILDTARAESGHLELDRKPTAPASFVPQALKDALRGRPESIADRIAVDLTAGVPPVHVDALHMQQALTHVLGWAIDAAQGSRVKIEIGDRDRPQGRAFVIEVSCDRETTPDEEAGLFQAFRKVPGIPGLHLQLPLARRLVEAHGGQMEALGGVLGVRIVLPRIDLYRGRPVL